jgi:hypothetical protein
VTKISESAKRDDEDLLDVILELAAIAQDPKQVRRHDAAIAVI